MAGQNATLPIRVRTAVAHRPQLAQRSLADAHWQAGQCWPGVLVVQPKGPADCIPDSRPAHVRPRMATAVAVNVATEAHGMRAVL